MQINSQKAGYGWKRAGGGNKRKIESWNREGWEMNGRKREINVTGIVREGI